MSEQKLAMNVMLKSGEILSRRTMPSRNNNPLMPPLVLALQSLTEQSTMMVKSNVMVKPHTPINKGTGDVDRIWQTLRCEFHTDLEYCIVRHHRTTWTTQRVASGIQTRLIRCQTAIVRRARMIEDVHVPRKSVTGGEGTDERKTKKVSPVALY